MICSFRIRSFEKYNHQRKNVSATYYFNVSNRFFHDPDWFDLSNDHRVVFFYAMAECSASNIAGHFDNCAKIHLARAAETLGLSVDKLSTVIADLESRGFFEDVQGLHRVSETSCQTPQKHTPCARKKERKKETNNREIANFSESDLDLATRWLGELFLSKGQVSKEKAAETLRQCREIDGFTAEELERIFQFVRQDDFWSKNAQSPASLRKKSDKTGLMKIQTIHSRMADLPQFKTEEQKLAEYEAEAERLYGPKITSRAGA